MKQKPAANELLRRLPAKWAVLIVVLLLAYAWLQPIANERWGWGLPSLASSGVSVESQRGQGGDAGPSGKVSSPEDAARGKASVSLDSLRTEKDAADAAAGPPTYGLLIDRGNQQFDSPAGLRYTRGSEEGHRLQHIERHLRDDPDRPGSHGVFEGDMRQVLLWLDEAYQLARSQAKGSSQRSEDGRTVYEATLPQVVGYVGGQSGKRRGNPEVKRIRLVVDGKRVITAFPF